MGVKKGALLVQRPFCDCARRCSLTSFTCDFALGPLQAGPLCTTYNPES